MIPSYKLRTKKKQEMMSNQSITFNRNIKLVIKEINNNNTNHYRNEVESKNSSTLQNVHGLEFTVFCTNAIIIK